jgi:fimbrial isopeptide formation D2 family protein/uncharacterized repeat protein (TIGR01451 family)
MLTNFSNVPSGQNFIPDGLTASVTLTTSQPTITKTIISTSEASTSGNNLVVGEKVQYRVEVTLPESTSTLVHLTDALDSGLALVSLDSISASSSVSTDAPGSFAGALAGASITSNGQSLDINLGNITNGDSNDATHETVVITYTAIATNISSNINGKTLQNHASWTWSQGNVTASAPAVTIKEPKLQIATVVTPSQSSPGGTVTYTVTISHTGASTADAFDTSLSDLLPASVTYVPGSLQNISGVAATLDDTSSTKMVISWPTLGMASSSVISFQTSLQPYLAPGQTVTTNLNLLWTSLPGDVTATQSPYNASSCERTGNNSQACGGAQNTYIATATANTTVSGITLSKTITGTSAPHTSGTNVAIGETVSYQLQVYIPDYTSSTNHLLTDTLDPGLALVSLDSIAASGTISTSVPGGFPAALAGAVVTNSGRTITINFGSITNSDTTTSTREYITLNYTAVVLNQSGNSAGVNRKNAATWAWSNGTTSGNSPNVTIREPGLKITDVPSTASADAGDLITHTITVQHTATSTVSGFEVLLNYLLPTDETYVSGTFANISGINGNLETSSTNAILFIDWSSLGTASSSVIQIQTLVGNTVQPSHTYSRTSTLTWSGLPGSIAGESSYNTAGCERTGNSTDCGGAQNTYKFNATSNFAVPAYSITSAITNTSATHIWE